MGYSRSVAKRNYYTPKKADNKFTLLLIFGVAVLLFILLKNQRTAQAAYNNDETWEIQYNNDGLPTKVVVKRQAIQGMLK